ncbi:PEP-CTERM sorting domain-containing protein [Candidatus Methylocalor cossyra]|uniref:PEP-CTERM protein-sorting domain-containing protein n=1 Tax=Candidatus Methylocalor cossyra TaxID=3108543 RepID=A0ABP1C946_9GAMM
MHRSLYWAIALVLTTLSSPSEALLLSGSFSGIAYNSRKPAPTGYPNNFDGSRVTGNFRIDIPNDYFTRGADWGIEPPLASYTVIYDLSHSSSMNFYAAGQEFLDAPQTIELEETPEGQVLRLWEENPLTPIMVQQADLSLVGPPGAFFSDLNLLTLHPGPVTLARAHFQYGKAEGYGATVIIREVTFDSYDPPPPAVPEPATWTALLAGLGAWRAVGAMRRGQRGFLPNRTGLLEASP